MKAGDFIEALERFFLDVIGTVLPGAAMLFGICYVTGKPLVSFSEVLLGSGSDYEWVIVIAFSYVLGHGVISLGSNVIKKWLEHVYRSELKEAASGGSKGTKPKGWFFSFVVPEQELSEKLAKDPIFKAFLASIFKRVPSLTAEANQITNYRTWRNLALSVAQENSHLVYRFTFLSLLNLGIATALIATSIFWLVLLFLKGVGKPTSVIEFNKWLPLMFAASPFFMERYYYFARIAFQLPISMALVKLEVQPPKAGKEPVGETAAVPIAGQRRLKVYLAGGFQSGWQSQVMTAVPSLEYLDPRSHGLKTKAEYTAWDLEAIRRSDCVFAYLEATNPGGYALALEVGFAKALGKFVIFVDEKSATSEQTGRYLEMITQSSDVSFKALAEGIEFLNKYRDLA